MEQLLKKAMRVSISEVLGIMFYMPLEFDEGIGLEGSGILKIPGVRLAGVTFSGPFSGILVFLAPEALLKAMTADFLGIPEASGDQMEGTLKEITNMVAGNTFSTYDSTAEFRLGIPEMMTPSAMKNLASGTQGFFLQVESVDGGLGVWMGLSS